MSAYYDNRSKRVPSVGAEFWCGPIRTTVVRVLAGILILRDKAGLIYTCDDGLCKRHVDLDAVVQTIVTATVSAQVVCARLS